MCRSVTHHEREPRTVVVTQVQQQIKQQINVFIAVMLARERRSHADTAADGCTELAAALAVLPSLTLKLVADAVARSVLTRERSQGTGQSAQAYPLSA